MDHNTNSGVSQTEDRLEFLSRIASMYYEEGMTQQSISAELGYSRSAISRFLTEARDAGIVEIRVHHPRERSNRFESLLTTTFGLKEARVLVRRALNHTQTMSRLGSLAARLLNEVVRDESVLGVSWGEAVYEVAMALQPRHRPDIKVMQLVGSLNTGDPAIDGPELARRFAQIYSGRYQTLPTPLLVDSAAVRDALIHDSHVEDVLEQTRDVEVAIVGVGTTDTRKSALVRAGYLTRTECDEIASSGAVGNVCTSFFNIQGEILDIPIAHRVVGVTPEVLRSIPLVIGVAGGANKTDAILGALRAGLITALVTDDETAKAVLDRYDQQ